MNSNVIRNALMNFVRDEEGAQVVEYALIIAVVSIALVLALGNSTTGISSKFATFVTRIGTCLSTGTC
jgi:pilus assembly protein Flp/PilA